MVWRSKQGPKASCTVSVKGVGEKPPRRKAPPEKSPPEKSPPGEKPPPLSVLVVYCKNCSIFSLSPGPAMPGPLTLVNWINRLWQPDLDLPYIKKNSLGCDWRSA